jgi:hypothetical protein
VLAANPATLPLTARFKKFFAQRTLAESTRFSVYWEGIDGANISEN